MANLSLFALSAFVASDTDASNGEYSSASDVIALTTENFDAAKKAAGASSGDLLIDFYAPWCGHCKTLAPIWEEIATDLKGVVNVAKVDATTSVPLAKSLGIKGFPTILLIHEGISYKFKGERTAPNIKAFANGGYKNQDGEPLPSEPGMMKEVPDRLDTSDRVVSSETGAAVKGESSSASDVIILTTDNFDPATKRAAGASSGDWLVEFYAPWCGHCRTLAPIWEEIATDLKGVVNVAKVDATTAVPLAKRFGIKGFPTILLFHKGASYKFKGKRTAQNIKAFANGGYKSEDGEPLPKEPGLLEEISDRLSAAWKRIMGDIEKRKFFTINILCLITPFIFLFFAIMAMFDSTEPKKDKLQPQPVKDKDKETVVEGKDSTAEKKNQKEE